MSLSSYDRPFRHKKNEHIADMTHLPRNQVNQLSGVGRITIESMRAALEEAHLYTEDLTRGVLACSDALREVPDNMLVRIVEFQSRRGYRHLYIFGAWKIKEFQVRVNDGERVTYDETKTKQEHLR